MSLEGHDCYRLNRAGDRSADHDCDAECNVAPLWVIGSLIVVSGAMAAIYHLLPGLHLWRGVSELVIILATGCALLTWHLLLVAGSVCERRVRARRRSTGPTSSADAHRRGRRISVGSCESGLEKVFRAD